MQEFSTKKHRRSREKPSRQKRGSLFCFQAFVPLFQQRGQSKQENDVKQLKAAECWEFYSLDVCQFVSNATTANMILIFLLVQSWILSFNLLVLIYQL